MPSKTFSPSILRSKIKLTTRDLKLALKQCTIMVEDFYPTHVLTHIIAQPGEVVAMSAANTSHNESGRPHTLPAGTRHVEINERSAASSSSRRKTEHRETKFASLEEWWDSKGLAPGGCLDGCGGGDGRQGCGLQQVVK